MGTEFTIFPTPCIFCVLLETRAKVVVSPKVFPLGESELLTGEVSCGFSIKYASCGGTDITSTSPFGTD